MKPEFIDLVDARGAVQLRGVPREAARDFADLHAQIVIVVIFNGARDVLVQRRSLAKKTEPGKLDHVCGMVLSGESPEDAAAREAYEEACVRLTGVELVAHGLNAYGRYRYLFQGATADAPAVSDPDEVMWAKFIPSRELSQIADENFVRGFRADLDSVNGRDAEAA